MQIERIAHPRIASVARSVPLDAYIGGRFTFERRTGSRMSETDSSPKPESGRRVTGQAAVRDHG
jgi:hypothetical protein